MEPEIYRVKLYTNRRLYNMEAADYVTLQHIAQAVKDGRQLVATRHKGGEDITLRILLDVLVNEQAKRPTLSTELLHHLVRNGQRGLLELLAATAPGVQK